MDYYKNADKWQWQDVPLYNSVLGKPEFADDTQDEPLSLEDAKAWCKIDLDTDDSLLTALIVAARIMCETFTNIGFKQRTITAHINNADGGFVLPYGPASGDTTLQDGDLFDDNRGGQTVTYTGGYADGQLPKDLLTALKAQVLFLYENRGESDLGLSPITQLILAPQRRVV